MANLGKDKEVTHFPKPEPARIVEPTPEKVETVKAPVREPVTVGSSIN